MNKKSIRDVDVNGKKCLVRVDFNVPTSNGQITDETRILGALPTIKYLSEHNAKVILCSHFGKPHNVFTPDFKLNKKELATLDALPESERDSAKAQMIEKAKGDVKKFSLEIVANRLKELLDCNVTFAHDTIGEDAQSKVSAMHCGDVVLLENTRFYAGEEKCDVEFCRSLARFADVFVNDAFGTAHRSHASTAGIVEHGFVKDAVCGFLIEKEISVMANALESPVHPFVAVLGGAKIADKLNVIDNLLDKCDSLIIGGGMAYTFLKAQGYGVGNSLVDDSKLEYCANMLAKAKAQGKTIYLPVDTVVADHFPEPKDAFVATKTVNVSEIPSQSEGLDIGAESQKLFADVIKNAKTVIWNGPMGVFENPCFAQGTLAVAKAMAESSAVTIVGGGDSVSAVTNLGFADKVTHVSTGGGASLELFEGKTLPGIACLNKKN